MSATNSDSDEGKPEQLSAATLAALQEFYTEERERQKKIESIRKTSSTDLPKFQEIWQLSQFWYDEETSDALATEALKAAGPHGKIALVSCPTLYSKIRTISKEQKVTIFEFDERFSLFGEDFCFYDYRSPLKVPANMAGTFDIVIADPPFLSEECLTKTAITIRFLAKDKLLLCTGAVMADLAHRLLHVSKTAFEPRHTNNLGNEFQCYANYETGLKSHT